MEKKKQMEFLNTLRFLSVVTIVFAHFNYQCFAQFFSQNILDDFCYNKESWLYYIFYGITGKYAVAMMCVISGLLVAKKFYRRAIDFGKFILNRYLRLMLPVFFIGTIFVAIRIIQGYEFSMQEYLNGVLWLGNKSVNEHLGYIIDFFIGNIFVALITYLFSNKKYLPLLYIPIIILLYNMEKIWILATVIGGLTYNLCEIIKEKKLYKYWYLVILIPILWWLPRGEEGQRIYLRDTIACALIVLNLYCLPKLQKVFEWNKIKNIKKISYSLFITHGLVNILFSGWLVQYFKEANIIENVYLLQIVLFFIVLIIDLVISCIVYYVAEFKLYKIINDFISKRMNSYKIELLEENDKI